MVLVSSPVVHATVSSTAPSSVPTASTHKEVKPAFARISARSTNSRETELVLRTSPGVTELVPLCIKTFTTVSVLFHCSCKIHATAALTLSPPIPLRLCTLPYWSNPPFLIFDIRALWRSGLSARVPECQKLKMVG